MGGEHDRGRSSSTVHILVDRAKTLGLMYFELLNHAEVDWLHRGKMRLKLARNTDHSTFNIMKQLIKTKKSKSMVAETNRHAPFDRLFLFLFFFCLDKILPQTVLLLSSH